MRHHQTTDTLSHRNQHPRYAKNRTLYQKTSFGPLLMLTMKRRSVLQMRSKYWRSDTCTASGIVRIAFGELCRRRRRIVPIQIFGRVPWVVCNDVFHHHYKRGITDHFLRALKPPGYHKEWSVAVRVASNKKLVAFISAVPITLRVRDKYV